VLSEKNSFGNTSLKLTVNSTFGTFHPNRPGIANALQVTGAYERIR
jgi:hypothetical protein